MALKTGRSLLDFEDFRSDFFMGIAVSFQDGEDWDECYAATRRAVNARSG
jgi:hypothetical protein